MILLLIVELAAVAEVLAPTAGRPLAALLPLLIIPVLGRWAVVIAAASFPLARPDGMGASFAADFGRREIILATLTTAVACLLIGSDQAQCRLPQEAGAARHGSPGHHEARWPHRRRLWCYRRVDETVALVAACLLIGS